MPRFHYNIYDGSADLDHKGMELLDWSEARLEAVRRAGMIFRDNPKTIARGETWHMEVADCAGLVLFQLDFSIMPSPALAGATWESNIA